MAPSRSLDNPRPRHAGRTKTSIRYANTARSETTRANPTCWPFENTLKQSECRSERFHRTPGTAASPVRRLAEKAVHHLDIDPRRIGRNLDVLFEGSHS